MALRARDLHPQGEPWVLVRDVLAEAAGADPGRGFDEQAAARAAGMRGVRYDWAGRPTVTWSAAAELLNTLRTEQAVEAQRRARQVAEQEQQGMVLPFGCVRLELPGREPWESPALVRNAAWEGVKTVEVPG